MKTSKNRTKKKDWQKADARILGQILAAQNIEFVLPDSTRIAEFFAETLISIPGIKACRICLREVSVQRGEMEIGICKSCEASRERVGTDEKISSFEPGFKCELAGQTGMQFNAIVSPYHHFGFFIFRVDDLDVFNVYKPFINNLANYVALSLENRLQRDLLQKARDELEFKVAERTKELRASNEAIKDLYNNAPCGYHSLDKDGLFILINDTELRWLGYSRDEIIGRVAFRDLLTADSLKTFEANFPGFKERGWVSDLEFEMVRKDGSILPVLLNATAITDSDGNYVTSRSTIFDITERKRAEESLHQSEERFRRLAENARDVIYRMSIPDGIYEYVSSAALSVFGYSPEECYKTPMLIKQAVHPDWHKYFEEQWANLIKGEIPPTYEYQFIHKSGEVRWLNQRNILVLDNIGNPIAIEGIVTDITERKQAEEALRESEQKFRSFVESSSEGFTLVDEQGAIIEWNQAREKMTGLPASQVIGQKLWDVQYQIVLPELQTPEFYERFKQTLLNALQTGQSFIFDRVTEAEVLHPHNPSQFIRQTIFPIKTDKGYRIGSVTSDITERKRAEQSLRESEERFRSFVEKANDIVYTVSPDGVFTYVSPNWKEILGHEISEVEGKSFEIFVHPDDLAACRAILNRTITSGEKQSGFEYRVRHKNGSWQWHTSNTSVLYDGDGRIVSFLGIARNITEHKRGEENLRKMNERFSLAVRAARLGVWDWDIQKDELDWDDGMYELYGVKREDFAGAYEAWLKGVHPDDRALSDEISKQAQHGEKEYDTEFRVVWPDGSIRYLKAYGQVMRDADGKPLRMTGINFDITDRKKAEVQLLASEQLFRALVEHSPDFIARYDREFRRIYVNPAIQRLFGSSAENVLGTTPADQSPLYAPQLYIDHLRQVIETAAESVVEIPYRTVQGEMRWGQMRFVPEFGLEGKVDSVIAIGRDIHEIKENERRFQMLAENFPDFVARLDHNGRHVYVNPAFEKAFGMPAESIIGKTLQELPQRSKVEQNNVSLKLIHRAFDEGVANESQALWSTKMGERVFEVRYVPEKDATGSVVTVLCIARDITERKQHEREHEVIIAVSTALRQAKTKSQILDVILDQSVELFEAEGATLVLPDPQTGGFIDEMGRGIVGERMTGLNIPPGKGVCNWVITNKQPYLSNHADHDSLFYRPELLGDSHCVAFVPLIVQEQVIGVLWIARQVDILEQDLRLLNAIADIAANAIRRVLLHEQTELQLHHLIALHQIDIAISSNFDSNITLNVILTNVKNELEVDAVSILLLNPVTLTLDYAAGIGFKTRNIEQSHVKLGDGCAGRAAQEYRTISCLDIGRPNGDFVRSSLLAGEEFEVHYATPLVVKGQVKGVLELFHRKTFETEAEWLAYFETLATQAAIAIESASLLDSLQRSNAELMLAYDATIEGWSRALDLRDRETEGHTQRVTEMALKLAEKMGMNDAEKIDLRRGSLLHDIGKMGVPDAILLKPGKLTDSEWEIMRRHPMYAYQMLSPISYLKHALEVSYCHHEKWDGSGYPRGLKGDEIPLAARVFAIVDVYDALTSDRPYRAAWPREKVYDYIREQAGKQFDPQVVKVFLEGMPY